MNVLINYLSARSGGAVVYMAQATSRLAAHFASSSGKHQLVVLCHEEQLGQMSGVPDGMLRVVTGRRPCGYRRLLWERLNLSALAGEEQSNVIFYPCQVAPRLPGVRRVMMLGNMEVFHYHKYHYSFPQALRNLVLKNQTMRCLARAERVIGISDYTSDFLVHSLGVPPDRVRRIYHGRDELFTPSTDTVQDKAALAALGIEGEFIFTCGSLLPYRRCEDVIAAFAALSASLGDRFSLVVAGTGPDPAYRKLLDAAVARSGCAARIRMVGQVPREVMAVLYRKSRVCVIASEVEACPNIAIEALASGCVIVAADACPLPEMLSGAAVHFGSRDISSQVGAIRRCLDDDVLRRDLAAQAAHRARYFSWDRCAEETFSALVDWS